ncbi:WAS WASL-interacting family member 3 isoform X1 [Olea europaea subsp. europaea]|nr:WAS WASL-interacting family member 3 isoform X1 [Olea europaea subsp. europaea]
MASSITPPPPPPPPPQPPKESFARRYKFIWPLLLAVNLTVGAYFFMRTKKKDVGTEETESQDVPTTPVSSSASATVTEKSPTPPLVMEPAKLRAPIPENQQRELFKWILDEKRKVKPKDPEEKKRIDEEKAILKQFIRAKSIPSL